MVCWEQGCCWMKCWITTAHETGDAGRSGGGLTRGRVYEVVHCIRCIVYMLYSCLRCIRHKQAGTMRFGCIACIEWVCALLSGFLYRLLYSLPWPSLFREVRHLSLSFVSKTLAFVATKTSQVPTPRHLSRHDMTFGSMNPKNRCSRCARCARNLKKKCIE